MQPDWVLRIPVLRLDLACVSLTTGIVVSKARPLPLVRRALHQNALRAERRPIRREGGADERHFRSGDVLSAVDVARVLLKPILERIVSLPHIRTLAIVKEAIDAGARREFRENRSIREGCR